MDEYYRAKNEMLCETMTTKCDEIAVVNSRKFLDKLCKERVKECLELFLKAPVGSPAPAVIYEILTQPEVMLQDTVISQIPEVIRIHGASMKDLCLREKRFMPSLLVLMCFNSSIVQKFVMVVFGTFDHQLSSEEFAPAYDLLKRIVGLVSLLPPLCINSVMLWYVYSFVCYENSWCWTR